MSFQVPWIRCLCAWMLLSVAFCEVSQLTDIFASSLLCSHGNRCYVEYREYKTIWGRKRLLHSLCSSSTPIHTPTLCHHTANTLEPIFNHCKDERGNTNYEHLHNQTYQALPSWWEVTSEWTFKSVTYTRIGTWGGLIVLLNMQQWDLCPATVFSVDWTGSWWCHTKTDYIQPHMSNSILANPDCTREDADAPGLPIYLFINIHLHKLPPRGHFSVKLRCMVLTVILIDNTMVAIFIKWPLQKKLFCIATNEAMEALLYKLVWEKWLIVTLL